MSFDEMQKETEQPSSMTAQEWRMRLAWTLKVYAHVIRQSQRDAMEHIGGLQSVGSIGRLLKFARK